MTVAFKDRLHIALFESDEDEIGDDTKKTMEIAADVGKKPTPKNTKEIEDEYMRKDSKD
jgi:hypothetical protein